MFLYPKISDPNFNAIINRKKEFRENIFVPIQSCESTDSATRGVFKLQSQQKLLKNYINPNTLYRYLLIFHGTGVGKTCAAITIAENFVPIYRQRYSVKKWNEEYIYILSGSDARENFKNELAGRCGPYKVTATDPATAEKEFKKITSKPKYGGFYRPLGYQEFTNRVEQNEITTVTNCTIIIDEAHMVTENTFAAALEKVFSKSKSYRVILLTATPMIHFASEIIDIFKLFSEDLSGVFEGSKYDLKLTAEGRKRIAAAARGKVSRLRGENPATFPRRIDVGEKVRGLSFPLVKCVMHDIQLKTYKEKYRGKIGTTLRPMLDLVMPDGTFGAAVGRDSKYWDKFGVAIPGPHLKAENLYKYSAKDAVLLSNLKKSIGKVFIYHRNVRGPGVKTIGTILTTNGYRQYVHGGDNHETFIIYHGELLPSEKKNLLSVFKSPENKNGKLIKYIIGSEIMMQSLDLNDIREVHIMHYQNNISTIEQIIGRASRHCSHKNLPRDQWTVKIFRYCSSLPNGTESAEEYRYIKKERAHSVIRDVVEILDSNSIDCLLNGSSNRCFPGESVTLKSPVDSSTYNVVDADLIDIYDTIEDIKALFLISPIWNLEDIIAELKSSLDPGVTYRALQKILDDKYTILNPAGAPGIIKYHGGLYMHITNESRNPSTLKTAELFLTQKSENTVYNVTDLLNQIQMSSRVSIHKHAEDLKHDLLSMTDPLVILGYMSKLPIDIQKMILERCIVAYVSGNIKENTVKILRAYKDFLLTDSDSESDISSEIPKRTAPIVGHMLVDPPMVWKNNKWIEFGDSGTFERGIENNIVVGYMDRNRNGDIVMKLQLPTASNVTDRRKINKGFVCGQISNRGVLVDLCKKLSIKIYPEESMDSLCNKIQLELRRRQRTERKSGGKIRWFYEYPEYVYFNNRI